MGAQLLSQNAPHYLGSYSGSKSDERGIFQLFDRKNFF